MSDVLSPREDYLQRLEDLLPTAEVTRIREDVDALIHDHVAGVQAADPEMAAAEAERRAVAALGSPERLAEELGVAISMSIPPSVRRAFVRALAVFFAGHIFLSIILTAAGAESPAMAGLLMPLPKGPFVAVLMSVVTIFLIDAGTMLVLFCAMGARRSGSSFPHLAARDLWTRKAARQGLLLLALLAVVFNFLLDPIFSVQQGSEWTPFLSTSLKQLVPYVNVVLVLLAFRHVLTLTGRGGSPAGIAADALAALSGCVLLTLAALSDEMVQMPVESLGKNGARVLDSLVERVFLLVFIVAALMLLARFVRQVLRLQRIWRS